MNERSNELIQAVSKYGANNYSPLPLVLNRGAGSRVWDVEGKEYLDFLSCYSALNFGHQHPRLVKRFTEQLGKLAVCSRAFYSEELCLFSKELAEFTGLEVVLPMNSGTEAVETAVKVARKWGHDVKGVPAEKAKIVVAKNNFHGRSIGIVSFSSEPLYRDGFGPYLPGFDLVEFGNLSELERALTPNCIAVLLEPIQAEAGILIPPADYLKKVRDLTREKNILLAWDEIQTGLGRCGKDFCYDWESAKPDLLILGKSLGGGLIPVSAVVSRKEVMDVIKPGAHGSTFGGNPLGAAVARESLKLLKEERLSERAQKVGATAISLLKKEPLPLVKEIRGRGLLIGIELEKEAGGARRYCERLATKGVLCKETHDNVIRIAPPLIISEEDLARGIAQICGVIREL